MGYILWKSCAVVLNVAVWFVMIGVLIGWVFPAWLGWLLVGLGVGICLKKWKDSHGEVSS